MLESDYQTYCLKLMRGCSTSAPELSSSVALAPLSKGVGTSEELIENISLNCRLGTFSSARRLQTKPNQNDHDSNIKKSGRSKWTGAKEKMWK